MLLRPLIFVSAFAAAAAFYTPANAMPLGAAASPAADASNSMIIKVGSRHRKRGHYGEYGYVQDSHVHAPYTHVEGSRGRVVVDAPYAYVKRSARHGVTVRAPYVDIRIP